MTTPNSQSQSPPSRTAVLLWCTVAYTMALAAACGAIYLLPDLHPVWQAAVADVAATVMVFAFSVAMNNTSMYDPYWSVAPIPIALYWAFVPFTTGADTARRIAVLSLVTLWGVRLTYNCFARWTDIRHEDFRYAAHRPKAGRAYWAVSFAGFHFMPTVVVFLSCVALYPALTSCKPFGVLDCIAILVTALSIWIEAASDRQLREFLESKPEPGTILKTGLWARSRHPNYFGEVLFWWGLFLFGLSAATDWWWTVSGAVSMTLLFAFISIPLMDDRMKERRPGYARHMKETPAFILRFWPQPKPRHKEK